jgi:hypothetical protein
VQKDSHLLEACRYMVLNPVRAKRVHMRIGVRSILFA